MKQFYPTATGLALLTAGAAALAFGNHGASLYGSSTQNDEAIGFVHAAGIRDIALGMMVLCSPNHGRSLLRVLSIVSALDLANVVVTSDDPPPGSLAIHAGGIGAWLLFARLTPLTRS